MEIRDEHKIDAPVAEVWAALNNPDVLRICIPGCERLEKSTETDMSATVVLKVGPIKARFEGSVQLCDLNPPFSYTIVGEGKGGVAGFAKGSAQVTLTELADGGTLLRYNVKADIGGKIAQLGSRLIDSTVRKLSAQFFSNFISSLSRVTTP